MRAPGSVTAALLVLMVAIGCRAPAPAPPPPTSTTPRPTQETGLAWRQLAAAPSARTEVAAAVTGTRVYVAGGFRADGGTVATVEVLDTATGRWTPGPPLPLPVNHPMATTVDGVVYVFGGYLSGGLPSAAAYRLDGDAWRSIADMPQARAAATAATIGRTVYLAGGIGPSGLADRMLVYDAAADRWSTAPGPPTRREHLGGAAFGGRVYTVGGRSVAIGNTAAFEVYDPGAGTWTALPPMPTPRGGLAATATCSGLVVAVGGEAEATFPEAEAYDTAAGTWRALPPLPTPRHGLGVVALQTTVYTLSGGPKPGLFVADSTEAIDLAPLGPCR